MNKQIALMLLLVLVSGTTVAHASAVSRAEVGLVEKLGQFLPADAVFLDENAERVELKERVNKPTIIAPVYLGCMHACPLLLTGLAQVLGRMELVQPGKDFQVVTLSFDEKDTPADALDKKKNYVKAIGGPFPDGAWTFLTGDEANIKKFTEAIGFTFQRDGEHDFSHPITLVVIAPNGKIVRYLEGSTFLPFEVSLAVTEASEGKIGSPARKALMYCFSYDPLKKSYVFNILKVTGTVMVLFVAGFLIYLLRSSAGRRL